MDRGLRAVAVMPPATPTADARLGTGGTFCFLNRNETMRHWRMTITAVAAALAALAGAGSAQQSSLTVSGDPQALIIRVAFAGLSPEPARDEGTVYSVSVTEFSDIVAQLDAPLPAGVTLLLQLEPPPGATGGGAVSLSTVPQTVVRSIPPGSYSVLGVIYELRATVGAGVVPISSRQITFTLTAGTKE